MTVKYHTVTREWDGDTVCIVGGGRSVTQDDVDMLRGRVRVLVINNSYQLAPWADALYFCDMRWWTWHKSHPTFAAFSNPIYTLENHEIKGVRHLKNMGTDGLQLCPYGVQTGRNSGIQSINLAVHLGVRRIVLLGYDMQPGHWHEGHPVKAPEKVYEQSMLPMFPHVAAALDTIGVDVVNCSPNSALTDFRRQPLADVMEQCAAPVRRRTA